MTAKRSTGRTLVYAGVSLLAVLALQVGGEAWAGTAERWQTRAERTDSGGRVEVAGRGGGRQPGGQPESRPSRPLYRDCSNHSFLLHPLAAGIGSLFGTDLDTATGAAHMVRRECTRIADAQAVDWFVGLPMPSDGDDVTGASVAAAAFAQLHLELPEVSTSPPRDGLQVVAVPVWFWIENFEQVSVTATIDEVSATLWATPTVTRIDTGEDGIVVTCDGSGIAYDTSRSHRDQESECSHAYDRHGSFTVNVTVTWTLHWEASTGEAGILAPVNRTATYETTITELQAVTH